MTSKLLFKILRGLGLLVDNSTELDSFCNSFRLGFVYVDLFEWQCKDQTAVYVVDKRPQTELFVRRWQFVSDCQHLYETEL